MNIYTRKIFYIEHRIALGDSIPKIALVLGLVGAYIIFERNNYA